MKIKGNGGNVRGHSNMDHWATTAEIKAAARSTRRNEAKRICHKAKRGEEI